MSGSLLMSTAGGQVEQEHQPLRQNPHLRRKRDAHEPHHQRIACGNGNVELVSTLRTDSDWRQRTDRPALLQTLHDTSSEDPRLGRRSRLLSEVHSEEEECGSRCDSVAPGGSSLEVRLDGGESTVQRRKTDKEEGEAEAETRRASKLFSNLGRRRTAREQRRTRPRGTRDPTTKAGFGKSPTSRQSQ